MLLQFNHHREAIQHMDVDQYVLTQLNETEWWRTRYGAFFEQHGERAPLFANLRVRRSGD